MLTYTIRFNNAQTARAAAAALRRRGMEVEQEGFDVQVRVESFARLLSAIERWALNRGALPQWHLIDWD